MKTRSRQEPLCPSCPRRQPLHTPVWDKVEGQNELARDWKCCGRMICCVNMSQTGWNLRVCSYNVSNLYVVYSQSVSLWLLVNSFVSFKWLSEHAALRTRVGIWGHCKESTKAWNHTALSSQEAPVFLQMMVTEHFPTSGIKQRRFM